MIVDTPTFIILLIHFQVCKAELNTISDNLSSLQALEERVSEHTVNKSVLQYPRLHEQYNTILSKLDLSLEQLDSDIQTWDRFDDSSSELMDKLLSIEHDVAAISLPDDAAGKQSIHTHLQVIYIKTVNKSQFRLFHNLVHMKFT